MIFSYKDLSKYYEKIKGLGKTLLFNEFNGQKCFLIRHDVDWDIELAYKLAQLENNLEIKSTYFILVSSNLYNVLSSSNRKLINKIKNLNHEIGLHFDASNYKSNYNNHAKKEAKILESIIEQKVNSISLHNPSVDGFYPKFPSFNDAYSKKYFKKQYYLSDARFDFRDKNPFDIIKKINESYIQISLHPLHFSDDGNKNYINIFNNLFNQRLKYFDQIQKKNSTYASDRLKKNYSIILK